MGLITKASTVGIDTPIQQLQKFLFDTLIAEWGITADDWDSYGRVYRTQRADGFIPEAFTANKEYKEVLLNDKIAITSFFTVNETIAINEIDNTATVGILFFVNLPKLSELTTRADEEIRADVQRILTRGIFGFTPTALVLGIANVFNDFSGWKNTNNINYRDMQPYHCFRFNNTLRYGFDDCEFPIN